jgi:3-deoxy-7-phosphoheptulonate synthase
MERQEFGEAERLFDSILKRSPTNAKAKDGEKRLASLREVAEQRQLAEREAAERAAAEQAAAHQAEANRAAQSPADAAQSPAEVSPQVRAAVDQAVAELSPGFAAAQEMPAQPREIAALAPQETAQASQPNASGASVTSVPISVSPTTPRSFEVAQAISGPCAVESLQQMEETAAVMAERGVRIIRGMGFKPRTSPYDFQGLGEEGLKIARQVANKYGMLVTSEIMDASQVPMFADYVDILWVGARNMQNSFLLRAVGKARQPVILKRHFAATLQEFVFAAEYIASGGNENVMLMERGIRTFEPWTRNTLDISAVPLLKMETHLPVIVDVSHSGGRRDLVIPLAKIAKASGADALMFETHPNPPVAMSDAKQQLSLPEFNQLMDMIEA